MTETVQQDVISRLAQHKKLGSSPPDELAWLAKHGTLHTYAVGDVVTSHTEHAVKLLIVFSGSMVIRLDRGAGSIKLFEWKGGDVGGVMPYSRVTSPPADVVAEEPTETLVVHRDKLTEMTRECPVATAILVHAMVDRARQFTTADLRDEKLISLGKLAAGFAHELNNPASAVVRSAKMLHEGIESSEAAARRLGAAHLTDAQLASIEAMRTACALATPTMSAVERSDREDAITDWLDDHDVDGDSAGPLAGSGMTVEKLDELAASVSGDALDAAIAWLAAGCSVRALSSEIETAASRIYDLVAAVKGFSYMDRAPTPEPVDIRKGIADTLTMLAAKARNKSVEVSMEIPADLPRAQAVGAEINQVWMNLIDNALDAVDKNGRVTVTARHELERVVVRVIDNGPGIPADIQSRIFDPFFTTKGVGSGTGLGLDIVRRLLQRLDGEISVESVPGRTEFQVRLPAASE
jgi:signal transduction histidine kinase